MTRLRSGLAVALLLALDIALPARVDAQIWPLLHLCDVIKCFTPWAYPNITSVLLNNVVEPGELILLGGTNFGSPDPNQSKGEVILQNVSYFPGFGFSVKLLNDFWSQGAVAVQLPKPFPTTPFGELIGDQPVTLHIKRADGVVSNKFTVFFQAEREIKVLAHTDPAVTLISCGDDGNFDRCNGVIDDDESPVFWQAGAACFATLCGLHENSWGAVGDDEGSDQFQINLKNGWTLHDISVGTIKTSTAEKLDGPEPSFPHGATSWSPQFSWSVTPNDRVGYQVTVFIKGPKGVPHF